jgi:5-formaminoimidazole-4-carboxamide-1-beta-D-ribofuranosyl 5'-monophosphate synthetase
MARSYADAHFVSNFLGQLNLIIGMLSSHSTLSVLVGALLKKFGLFLIRGVYWYF